MAISARACPFFALAFTRVGSVLLFTPTHASFLYFLTFSLPRGNFGCAVPLFRGPRELRVFLCTALAPCGNYRGRKPKPGPVGELGELAYSVPTNTLHPRPPPGAAPSFPPFFGISPRSEECHGQGLGGGGASIHGRAEAKQTTARGSSGGSRRAFRPGQSPCFARLSLSASGLFLCGRIYIN
jgi:hypothetical protein